ncbi:MAG: uncharacterized protein QOD99_1876 [Chthoniobacter sp.]|nr:uncharacterized protein [Chthoniobacter sp.]
MQPGKVGWNELVTSDPAAAIQFYTTLFGWETEKFPNPENDYTMFKHGGQAFGGVMKSPKEGVPTMWTNYVMVEDVDATVAKSTSLGGKTCMPPMDIPMVGRIAVITDPQGAAIGLHQPPKQP